MNPLRPTFEAPLRERVVPILKKAGFKKKALTFRRSTSEVLQILDVQKSRNTDSRHIVFAVNLGVASLHLLQRFGGDAKRCTVWVCHLHQRVGGKPFGADHWWKVRDNATADAATDQVLLALSRQAMPLFEKLRTDVALLALWKTGRSPGTTDLQRLLYVAELTRKYGSAAEVSGEICRNYLYTTSSFSWWSVGGSNP